MEPVIQGNAKRLFLVCVVVGILLSGCATFQSSESEVISVDSGILQVSVIDALLQGCYEGTVSLGELSGYGDFGIGTFDGLDGEMVLLDGVFYQVKADGSVVRPGGKVLTPFASVMTFTPEIQSLAVKVSYPELQEIVKMLLPSNNLYYGIRIDGTFSKVHTRSVPAQIKPYPPLVEVTKKQQEFFAENSRGTVVGFYAPAYAAATNVPGFHLHYISRDKSFGGHVLDLEMVQGTIQIDQVEQVTLLLPDNGDFIFGDFTKDRSADLEKVEKK